jgi:uncharacterized protein (DUF2267 family)
MSKIMIEIAKDRDDRYCVNKEIQLQGCKEMSAIKKELEMLRDYIDDLLLCSSEEEADKAYKKYNEVQNDYIIMMNDPDKAIGILNDKIEEFFKKCKNKMGNSPEEAMERIGTLAKALSTLSKAESSEEADKILKDLLKKYKE